jgi:arylsulfatase A-like enzyme
MKKGIYFLILFSLPALLTSCGSRTDGHREKKDSKEVISHPNLVVIMADDLGYQDVGFNGCEDIPTPNINRIAANGMVFTSGYTTYSVCSPSRAGFLTGRYGSRFGYERNPLYRPDDPNMGLTQDEKTIAESLSDVGYKCGAIGKWHLGSNAVHHPLNRGFDEFFGHLGGGHQYFPEELVYPDSYAVNEESQSYRTWIMKNHGHVKTEKYLTEEFSEEAVRFVEQYKNEPFFLYLAYNAPHAPLQATEKYLSRFENIANPKRKTYAAMVSALDDGVGLLLDKIKELELEENTLIFFLSDNGGPEQNNGSDNGPLREGKSSVYEGGFRVPFAVQWKGKITPGIYHKPVSSMDVFATISSLSGSPINPEKPLDGVNLMPFLSGEKDGNPHDAIYLRQYDKKRFAVRKGDYKLVTLENAAIKELYNLIDDMGEANNIAENQPNILLDIDSLRKTWNKELIRPAFLGLTQGGAWGWEPKEEEIYEVK